MFRLPSSQPQIRTGDGMTQTTAAGARTVGFTEYENRPAWTPVWLPIAFLNRKTDNTYLVRVEAVPNSNAIGKGWIEKGYFADDEQVWLNESNRPIERDGVWQITAFAQWPELDDIVVGHASDCSTSGTPAFPAGPCNCGADLGSSFAAPKTAGGE